MSYLFSITQDDCDGHPEQQGMYHYHNMSRCLKDSAGSNEQSNLIGYALDGFGIYGPKGPNGKVYTNADLDECHGITSEIMREGKKVSMYHYVATHEYPYTIGCFKGTPATIAISTTNTQASRPQSATIQTNQQSQSAPTEALNACKNKKIGDVCSFIGINKETISSTCMQAGSDVVCGAPKR